MIWCQLCHPSGSSCSRAGTKCHALRYVGLCQRSGEEKPGDWATLDLHTSSRLAHWKGNFSDADHCLARRKVLTKNTCMCLFSCAWMYTICAHSQTHRHVRSRVCGCVQYVLFTLNKSIRIPALLVITKEQSNIQSSAFCKIVLMDNTKPLIRNHARPKRFTVHQ